MAAGVGIAGLDGACERPHGEHVGLAQLLGAGALLLERLAQVGRVALELALLVGRLAGTPRKLGLELRDALLQLLGGQRRHLPPAAGPVPSADRSALTACVKPSTGIPIPLVATCRSPSVLNRMTERPWRRPRRALPSTSWRT